MASDSQKKARPVRRRVENGIDMPGPDCRAHCAFSAAIALSCTRLSSVHQVSGRLLLYCLAALLFSGGSAIAEEMYKYRGESGVWVYTDRPPEGLQNVETRKLPTRLEPPTVTVTTSLFDRRISFIAHNEYRVPVAVKLVLDELRNLELPHPGQTMLWVIQPQSDRVLFELDALDDNIAPEASYRFIWLPGDPNAEHSPNRLYRAPFSVASDYPVTQAFPTGATHLTPDSHYAVDIAMPIGTNIHAARGGLVFEVASTNFRGGTDPAQYMALANFVRIMHDDGSHAVYAHLNLNSIRVRPGDRVERGEYIADSGNTGLSSGPHLHFAVIINRNVRAASVPVLFEGRNSTATTAMTGNSLPAY